MDVSIIVCTLNRADQLALCLPTLSAAIAAAPDLACEVVVVDNGSTDTTAEVITAWASTCSHRVTRSLQPTPGLATARNTGVAAAKGDLVIFTDDDCRMDTSYVRAASSAYRAEPVRTLMGGVVALGDPADIPMSITRGDLPFRYDRASGSARRVNINDPFMGCNMVIPALAFRELGPFDERIGAGTTIPGGEDSDFFMRAYTAGFGLAFKPELRVEHFHGRRTPAQGLALNRNYSLGTGALYLKHGVRQPDFLRPLAWDARNLIKDAMARRNSFQPLYGFTYGHKLLGHALGAYRFARTGLRSS